MVKQTRETIAFTWVETLPGECFEKKRKKNVNTKHQKE